MRRSRRLTIALAALIPLSIAQCYYCNPYEPDCDPEEEERPAPRPQTVGYANLFPFENNRAWWRYTTEEGNEFVIEVVDTISDERDIYYKVSFTEAKLDKRQDDWFVREAGEITYGQTLRGTFQLFLPSSYCKTGGSFHSGSSRITYTLHDTFAVGGTVFHDVVELRYTTAILHGFDTIYFADGVGIVALVDEDGRWPIEYVLESSGG